MNVSPSGLSVGGIPEGYSDCTPGGIRGTQGFNGKDLDISLGCHQASLVQLHPASVVEPGGTRKVPASVRDRLSPTMEGKLQCKVCLYPHLEQGAEKAMTTHSSTLAWKIPWTEEPGRLQSMGSLRVRHD